MTFIRAKEIPKGSGNWYDYEVESVWINGKPRQRHIRYIGVSTRHASMSGRPTAKKAIVVDATLTPIPAEEHNV